MKHEVEKLLYDILESISIIETYIAETPDLSTYKLDVKTIDAVERRLAIVGEALWKADKIDKSLSISNKNKIISLRHILIHDYDLVEDETIWIICKKHLPTLKEEAQAILKNT